MSSAPGSAPSGLKLRLCLMMFLEIFIWGAWYPVFFSYVPKFGFGFWENQLIFNAFHFSALVAIFFGNQFADRTFAAEKFLAFSQFVGGAAMIGLWFVRPGWVADLGGAHINVSFWAFFALILLHTLVYVPTISITNAIAFANLRDPAREFGVVRMFGTIGWIVAALPWLFILADWEKVPKLGQEAVLVKAEDGSTVKVIPVDDANRETLRKEIELKKGEFEKAKGEFVKTDFVLWVSTALAEPLTGNAFRDASALTFLAAGLASMVLALFSFTLPHTPPKPSAEPLAWLEAMKLLRHPFILILFIVTFIDAAVHQMYFFWTAGYLENGVKIPGNFVQPVMAIGQVAEILTMAVLGYVLKSFGWRFTMVIGILGHAARFAVFAFAPQPIPTIAVILLHGICYAFFFATVYIFIEEYFPPDARASAQGLFNMLILGVGPFVSNLASGQLGKLFATSTGPNGEALAYDYRSLFLVPTITAISAAILLLLFFHPPPKPKSDVPT